MQLRSYNVASQARTEGAKEIVRVRARRTESQSGPEKARMSQIAPKKTRVGQRREQRDRVKARVSRRPENAAM